MKTELTHPWNLMVDHKIGITFLADIETWSAEGKLESGKYIFLYDKDPAEAVRQCVKQLTK